ncbi:MAG: glycoside hydrolase family 2, partial [Clostridia bacterium]|nr:glycoside hydrolase family 2 [Clostridia bacterium]
MIFNPQFSTDGVLNEYPRPQLKRDSYLNLNGKWDFTIKHLLGGKLLARGKINVPYSPESALSGVGVQVKNYHLLTYTRSITLPEGFNRGKLLLNFGAVDQLCRIYVGDKLAGLHAGGYTPFTVDITKFVEGNDFTIRVDVIDDADSEVYGRGKQVYKRGGIWYTATSGIWQTVWLESVTPDYIKSVKLTPNYFNKTLSVLPSVDGKIENFRVEVLGDDGSVLCASAGRVDKGVTLDVSSCKPWSTEDPQLYPVKIYYGDDLITSYFGLRSYSSVEVDGKKYFA